MEKNVEKRSESLVFEFLCVVWGKMHFILCRYFLVIAFCLLFFFVLQVSLFLVYLPSCDFCCCFSYRAYLLMFVSVLYFGFILYIMHKHDIYVHTALCFHTLTSVILDLFIFCCTVCEFFLLWHCIPFDYSNCQTIAKS